MFLHRAKPLVRALYGHGSPRTAARSGTKPLFPELEVVRRSPADDLKFARTADALRLTGRHLADAFAALGGADRHQRLPANDRAKQLFGQRVSRIAVEAEVVHQVLG